MDASIDQFERKLEQLEMAVRQGDSLTNLMSTAASAISIFSPGCDILLQVLEQDVPRLRLSTSRRWDDQDPEGHTRPRTDEFPASGNQPARQQPPKSREPAGHNPGEITVWSAEAESDPDDEYREERFRDSGWMIALRRRLSIDHWLSLKFILRSGEQPANTQTDAAETVADLLSEAVTRHLLSHLTEQSHHQAATLSLVKRLSGVSTVGEWARIVTQYAVEHLGQGRVSVCRDDHHQWVLTGVTGADVIQRQAAEVIGIEASVSQLADASTIGEWVTPIPDQFDDDASSVTDEDALRMLQSRIGLQAPKRIRLEWIVGNDGSIRYGLLIEVFDETKLPKEPLVKLILTEISESFRHLPPERHSTRQRLVHWLRVWRFPLVLVAVMSLLLIPVRFEIAVSAQAFPVERRRIFAPDDGILEELLVDSDDRVQQSQKLLRIRSPERELDINRVLGEIAALSSRLQAIRATRTDMDRDANGQPRSHDLNSEELQVESRLKTLREEQSLLEQHAESLHVRSPIAGQIYQRRLREQLQNRPVRRGQLLMEVVNAEDAWQLELEIPESVIGYLRAADSSQISVSGTETAQERDVARSQNPEIRFQAADNPGAICTTRLRSIESAAYIRHGRLVVQAFADVPSTVSAGFRPGQSVEARISCGTAAAGFVWFREVAEFWQRKRFAWFSS